MASLQAQAPARPVHTNGGGAAKSVKPPPQLQAPVPIRPTPADSARADAEIDEVGLRYAANVRGCYEREGLRQDPSLGGLLEVTLTVLPEGTVREVTIDTTAVRGMGMGSVTTCVAQSAVGWRFSSGPFAIERVAIPFSLVPPPPAGQRTSSN